MFGFMHNFPVAERYLSNETFNCVIKYSTMYKILNFYLYNLSYYSFQYNFFCTTITIMPEWIWIILDIIDLTKL